MTNAFGGRTGEWSRDLREEMMDDVEFDDTMEDMLANPAKFTVDCCGGTLDECPGLGFEFG